MLANARLYAAGAALAAIGLALWLGYSWAYGRGEAARDAYYEPLLAAAELAKAEAEARLDVQKKASASISARKDEEYQHAIAEVSARARDLERRLADLSVRNEARARSDQLPGVPAAACEPAGGRPEPARARRTGEALVGIAERAELDARQLTALIAWIREQQALYEAAR